MILEHLKDRLQGKAAKGERRSPRWPVVRSRFLRAHPKCAACGATRKVQVHHIIPFQLAPEMELSPENLITLCTGGRFKGFNCHLIIGHLGNYQRVNEMAEADAAEWEIKLRRR